MDTRSPLSSKTDSGRRGQAGSRTTGAIEAKGASAKDKPNQEARVARGLLRPALCIVSFPLSPMYVDVDTTLLKLLELLWNFGDRDFCTPMWMLYRMEV